MAFQLVRVELNADGQEVGRRVTQPLYERREDAMAIAEYDAAWREEYGRHSSAHFRSRSSWSIATAGSR